MKRPSAVFATIRALGLAAALAFAACGGGRHPADAAADRPAADDVAEAPDAPDGVDVHPRDAAADAPDPAPADVRPADAPTADTPDPAAADALPADVPDAWTADALDAVSPDAAPDVPPSPTCDDGLPRRPFVDAPDQALLGALAADLAIPTTGGPFGLKAGWDGCQSFLFLQDRPAQNGGWPDTLFQYNVNLFLFALPRSAQVFFVSVRDVAADRESLLAGLQGRVEQVLAGLPSADAASLRSRIHYVTGSGRDLPGWLGSLMRSPGWGVGIDRFQHIRFVGSYADENQYDASKQWFAPNLRMAANEAVYYDFEARREAALDAEDAVVVPAFAGEVLSDPDWAGTRGYADVLLPDAATMATFDTLELDLRLGCVGDGEYGDCPAWDYIANVALCDADAPDRCDVELGRWITTYHREGRWVHDVTPLLPLLADGGTRRLAFYTQQPYEVSLSLRLSRQGKATRPREASFLFAGGDFGPGYNDARLPLTVPVPADAAKVELAVIVTGHGGAQPGNCAEFCSPDHHFAVNGVDHVVRFTEPGDPEGCLKQTAQGTVPNQYGTWWYGRDGWCPGREVDVRVLDVTADVVPGTDATVEYHGFWQGAPYPSGGANIDLASWWVVER